MQDSNFKLYSLTDSFYCGETFETRKFIKSELNLDPMTNLMKQSKFKKNIIQVGEYPASLVDPKVHQFAHNNIQEVFIFGTAGQVRDATRDLITLLKKEMEKGDIGYILKKDDQVSIVFHFNKHLYPIIINPTHYTDMYSIIKTVLTTAEQCLIRYSEKGTRVLGTKRFIDTMKSGKLNLTSNKTTLTHSEEITLFKLYQRHNFILPERFRIIEYFDLKYLNEYDWFQPQPNYSFNKTKWELLLRAPNAPYHLFFHSGYKIDEIFETIRPFLIRKTPIKTTTDLNVAIEDPTVSIIENDLLIDATKFDTEKFESMFPDITYSPIKQTS